MRSHTVEWQGRVHHGCDHPLRTARRPRFSCSPIVPDSPVLDCPEVPRVAGARGPASASRRVRTPRGSGGDGVERPGKNAKRLQWRLARCLGQKRWIRSIFLNSVFTRSREAAHCHNSNGLSRLFTQTGFMTTQQSLGFVCAKVLVKKTKRMRTDTMADDAFMAWFLNTIKKEDWRSIAPDLTVHMRSRSAQFSGEQHPAFSLRSVF